MSEALQKLIEAAKKTNVSEEEREEQRRSFAFGNTKIENPLITREMIDEEADKLSRK